MIKYKYTDDITGQSITYEAPDNASFQELHDLGIQALGEQNKGVSGNNYEQIKNNPVTTKPREFSTEL